MKYILLCLSILMLVGCNSSSYDKQKIVLECQNGIITYKWYKARNVPKTLNIGVPDYLEHSGIYTDDNNNYMKCVKD